MKWHTWVLITIAAIIALPLIIALFAGKDYALEREITINRSKDQVFEYIRHLENQTNYSKWGELDPDAIYTYTGVDGTVGFVSAWEGNKDVGRGEQEITRIIEGERVETQIRFFEPFKAVSEAYMTTESIGENQTRLNWGFSGRMPWPMNLFLLVMSMEDNLGADYEYGLEKIKNILESQDVES